MIPKEMIEAARKEFWRVLAIKELTLEDAWEAALTAALSVQWRGMESEIQAAGRTVDLWNRVCGEISEGKDWNQIDDGLRTKVPVEGWEAYMRQRMYHQLQSIVMSFRLIMSPPPTTQDTISPSSPPK